MYRKKICSFFVLVVLLIFLPITVFLSVSYIRDPLYLFHASKNGEFQFCGNMRFHAAGIIDFYEFDAVILGTSMLRNSSGRNFSKYLGGKFVNISLSGATFTERAIVLNYLFSKKNISKVIYSVDLDAAYLNCRKNPQKYDLNNWDFLYDEEKFNDFRVYMNKDLFKNIFLGVKKAELRDLDMPDPWVEEWIFNRFGGIHKWIEASESDNIKKVLLKEIPKLALVASPQTTLRQDRERVIRLKKYFEDNIFSIAAENKNTIFYLVFPPYWRYRFAKMRQYEVEDFSLHQEAVRYAVKRAEELSNVQIYGFEDCAFVDNVSQYMDVLHYHPDINKYIADSIGRGRHRLTPEMLEAYLARCDELSRAFDFKSLAEEVKRALDEKREGQDS